MKKITFVVQLCFITSILTAQITRQQADDVVYEYIQQEVTRPYYLATSDDFPDENGKTTIVTSKEETFSVDYPCWVYYVDERSDVNGPHPCVCLFVNQKDGDYLEVKIRKSFITDLENWRIMHTPSDIAGIKDNSDMIIFPNPVGDFLDIPYKGILESMTIYNLAGVQVFNKSFQGFADYKSNIAFLNKGHYIVSIFDKKGIIKSYKIIKK
jgi:hypothetical protein